MSQSSYFKVAKNYSTNTSSFGTRKVKKWIESLHSVAITSNDLAFVNEKDDYYEEMDWDDTGSVISNSRDNRSFSRESSNAGTPIKSSSKHRNATQNVPNIRMPDYFARPFTPKPPKSHKIQTSKKHSLTTTSPENDSKNLYEICPSRNKDLNQSFDIFNNSMTSSGFEESDINSSFQNINSYLHDIMSYCASLDGSQRSEQINMSAKTDEINNLNTADSQSSELPKLPYNENSIDLIMAYNDPLMFAINVHNENVSYNIEESFDEYMDSQIYESQQDLSVHVTHNINYTIDKDLPKHERLLQEDLNTITKTHDFSRSVEFARTSTEMNKATMLFRISKIFAHIYENYVNGKKMRIEYPRVDWKNTTYNNILLLKSRVGSKAVSVLQGRVKIVLYLLRKIQSLLIMKTKLTQRSIYYQLKSILGDRKLTQSQVSGALQIVSNMLEAPLWHLNVMTTSKGLVYGDLILSIGSTNIKCNAQNGTIIPNDLTHLQEVKTSAYFILIVEKDTIFQKLLTDNLNNKLSRNFILVTGKGYPDSNTRYFLNILWRLLEIPMFMVVDADAYGIDIFLTYRFGSLSMCYINEELALPKLKWFGVLPSEIRDHAVSTLPLLANDRKRLGAMLKRPYFQNRQNREIREEIETLLRNKTKCEIEGVFKSNMYFVNNYLPSKIYKRSFL